MAMEQGLPSAGMPPVSPGVAGQAARAAPQRTAMQAGEASAGGGPEGAEEAPNVSQALQQEYEQATEGLGDMLYRDQKTSDAFDKMLLEEDPIGTTIQASLIAIQQLDQRLDLDEGVFQAVTQDAVNMLMELGEAKGLEYSGREAQQITAAVWEGVMQMVGGDDETIAEDYGTITQGMNEGQINDAMSTYKQLLSEGSGMGEQNG